MQRDFNKDVILPSAYYSPEVRISFDGAEHEGRVWVHEDGSDEMIAIEGPANCIALAGLLLEWVGQYKKSERITISRDLAAQACSHLDDNSAAKWELVEALSKPEEPTVEHILRKQLDDLVTAGFRMTGSSGQARARNTQALETMLRELQSRAVEVKQ